jgi:hypothetical protein
MELMQAKVLLAAPINQRKAYILDEWLSYVNSLTYTNLTVLLVDNSDDKEWHKSIIAKGFDVIYHKPKGAPSKYIAESQNILRQYAIDYNFDYLFSLECDNFAPRDIVERLLSYHTDNINVPYFLKLGTETTLGIQMDGIRQAGFTKYDVMPAITNMVYFDGKLKTGIPSIGCSLFSRKLLTLQEFRHDPNNVGIFSDSFWHMDSINNGITPIVVTDLISTHKRKPEWNLIKHS